MQVRKLSVLLVIAWIMVTSPILLAQDEGLDKLDAATTAKIDATTAGDLEKVIKLCEEALELGLDEDNAKLANQILSATALQRAQLMVQSLPSVARNQGAVQRLRVDTLRDLDKAVAADPKLSEAWILMFKLELLPGGSRDKALSNINKAIDSLADKPVDQSTAYVMRAGLRDSNEDRLADLEKALKVNPVSTEALQAKIALQLALGKLEEVVAEAEAMMAKDENNLFAFEAAIRAMVGLEKYDEAIALLTKRIELDGDKAVYYRIRAQNYLLKDDEEKAMMDLDKAVELDKADSEALVMRGRLHFFQDDITKASRDISDALLINPDNPEGVLWRSMISAREQRYADAIADMERLVRADPSNVTWQEQLASLYQADDRPRLAIRLLDELIRNNADNWRAFRLRGDAKLSISEHDEAVADYDTAIGIVERDRAVPEGQKTTDIDYSGLLNNLSWVLSTSPTDDLRDGSKSLELALKACEATEYQEAHILSTLAAAYAEMGNFEKAREWSQKAIDIAAEEAKEDPKSSQLEELKLELESYKKDKPWREEKKTDENNRPVTPATDTIDT